MGQKFFGADIQNIIASAMGAADLPKIVLIKKVYSSRSVNLTEGVASTTTQYVTRGVEGKSTIVSVGDAEQASIVEKEVTLIAKPLVDKGVQPEINDQIASQGRVFTITSVDRDPATATYTVTCRSD